MVGYLSFLEGNSLENEHENLKISPELEKKISFFETLILGFHVKFLGGVVFRAARSPL